MRPNPRHSIPHSLAYSVPLLMKRQCDRTLGMDGIPPRQLGLAGKVAPAGQGWLLRVEALVLHTPPPSTQVRKTPSWPRSWANFSAV